MYLDFYWNIILFLSWFFILYCLFLLNFNNIKVNLLINLSYFISYIYIIIIYLYNLVMKKILTRNEKFIFFFLVYLFIYICFINFLGLTGLILSSYFTFAINLSLFLWLSILIRGFFLYKFIFFKIFVSNLSWVIIPILICLESFSFIMRIFSLGIRLSINMLAGHVLVHILISFWILIYKISLLGFFFFFFLIFGVCILEFIMIFIQAYIFVVLFSIYLMDL